MANNYFPTSYQEFIHLSRYSRWLPDKERRETWDETVARYFDFFTEHLKDLHEFKLTKELRDELEEAVLSLKIMPSMRCIMTAGEALKRENIAGYNCSYIAIDRVQSFDEVLYVLMNGTGVGFSVERQYVSQLPVIAEEFHPSDTVIVVADSKLGWARAFKELLGMLYIGQIPRWDTSKVRPAGAPLKTFGGRASGPEPLEALFNFSVNIFRNASGRKLSSVECHDIVCKIADIVVVGANRNLTYRELNHAMRLVLNGAELICSGTTQFFKGTHHSDTGYFLGESAIAQAISHATGKSIRYIGKPYPEIYNNCVKGKEKVLAIGDNLNTDIKGANMMNYHCLFILNGIHKNLFASNNNLKLEETLKKFNLNINYYQNQLEW